MSMILGASTWANNSELIADVARLGYLTDSCHVVDVTYGRGNWWRTWQPEHLTAHDIALDGVDFRALPEADGTVDAVAFDPPYIPQGGRASSTIQTFLTAYGLHEVPGTTNALHEYIVDGIREAHRILRPRGVLLFKCMNYVNGGRYRIAAYDLLHAAITIGFTCADEFVHVRTPGPQPARDRQHHARRNYSHLFVLRKVAA